MKVELFWSDKLKRPDAKLFAGFAQKAVNRLLQGWTRYGFDPKFRYMTRLEAEVKAYRKTGNCEHLVNAANYAYMESEKPEHPRSHWDTLAKSATRKREWFGDDNA